MNYPLWDLPASGLLIAIVAILHVFVSHFAVGGGLFLVLTEIKARRENDPELLDYLRRHSRFFILLTLVFGAITGVGIWFTIALVHPAATSTLINAFVWGWAIEWTFFLTEIAAAIVYYYGWDKLTPKQHLTVGWIYFGAAWLSLVVINGILTFMLTPGTWVGNREFWAGFFNPTYWPALFVRTFGAIGIAGIYALFTAAWLASPELKRKLSRYAAIGWVLPMAIGLPLSLIWYFAAASGAGVPVGEIFGVASSSPAAIVSAIFNTAATKGYPVAQLALRVAAGSITLMVLMTFALFFFRRERFGRVATGILMIAGLLSIGGAEWVREDLRKPWVIGSYMFVNGIRMPAPAGSTAAMRTAHDPIGVSEVMERGVLAQALWTKLPPTVVNNAEWEREDEVAAGREVYRLLCSNCHTSDGYLAIRPLLTGRSSGAIEGMLDRLAVPHAQAVENATWTTPGVQLVTWRERRMPPFTGSDRERRALAVYLATLGGGKIDAPLLDAAAGESLFESSCAACHSAESDWPIASRIANRSEDELHAILGELPQRNEMMPPFEGTEAERHELARYLATLAGGKSSTSGEEIFEDSCAMCHSSDAEWPIETRIAGWTEAQLYGALAELPQRNETMPPFEGSDEERRALALYLHGLTTGR